MHQEERQVGNDNCVSFNRLKLQIPESPLRAHFVKTRVKVRQYPDGTHAIFYGPRCLGRYDKKGVLMKEKSRLNSLEAGLWKCGQSKRLDHSPTGEQKQKKRTFDVLPKPAKLISLHYAAQVGGCSTSR